MKKSFLTALVPAISFSITISITVGMGLTINSAYAEQAPKIETANETKLPEVCQTILNETNKLLIEAEKQPGTHPQVKALKDSLTETKKDLQKLDSEMQTKSCEKSLDGLNKLKESQEP